MIMVERRTSTNCVLKTKPPYQVPCILTLATWKRVSSHTRGSALCMHLIVTGVRTGGEERTGERGEQEMGGGERMEGDADESGQGVCG